MKTMIRLAVSLWALILLSACGQQSAAAKSAQTGTVSAQVLPMPEADSVTIRCTLVDGAAEGNLLLAQRDAMDSGVYRVNARELPVTVDGAAAQWADLSDGMSVEVTYSGDVLETFPAQLAQVTAIAAQTPVDRGNTDLCGLYLQVLDDLWKTDTGLNSDLKIAGVDLSQEPGNLSAAEKAAVIWRFGEEHGVETVDGTYAELTQQGYIDSETCQWKDGCLFSISANHSHDTECYSMPVLFFDAEKWRSGTGAYFFSDCSCLWPESGSWTLYTVGTEAIS